MRSHERLSGLQFWARFSMIVSSCGSLSALMLAVYLVLLLRMPPDQIRGLALIAAVILVPTVPIGAWVLRRSVRPVVDWLDREQRGETEPEVQRRAFRAVVNLPGRILMLGLVFFVVPASLSVLGLFARFEEFEPYHALLMLIGVLSAAGLSSIIEGLVLKRWLTSLRAELTQAIGNPTQRLQLTRPISLVSKLQAVICVCTLAPAVLVGLVGHTGSTIRVEELTHSLQQELASDAISAYRVYGEAGITEVEQRELARSLAAEILLLDRTSGSLVRGRAAGLTENERSRIRESSEIGGASDRLGATNLYVWRNTADGRYSVVVSSSRSRLIGDRQDLLPAFLGLFAACLLLALGVGWLVAQDVGGPTQLLGAAADRMASGDLRAIDVPESEDEFGMLRRSFDAMGASLRSLVGEVTETADGIDDAASNISDVARGLHSTAEGQGRDVRQVVDAMQAVERQGSEITSSSNELRHLVEEFSSSILELGASGDQLNQTAGSLSERVEAVAATVEQTLKSVRHVGSETHDLADAAADTSSSMEEMASAMRHVDRTAAETAALSEQVVAASEFGHNKVLATMEGIESIRSATETAHSVILRLGGRAQEIGGILDVIDDVADETNLLALNAAIIAAQAGDHGRAFSVVAREIKQLANRVLASTKEISGLIHSVQQESQSAIDAMKEGSRSVAVGVERSSEAGRSLEEITSISRDSGQRIREIVESVQEQTKAAGNVVGLMDRVQNGVQAIQRATSEQEHGNELVCDASQTLREVAQQLHLTTAEQAAGLARMREGVSGVSDQTESINGALHEQSASCNEVVGFLEEVSSHSVANERAAHLVGKSTDELSLQVQRLRAEMRRFQR